MQQPRQDTPIRLPIAPLLAPVSLRARACEAIRAAITRRHMTTTSATTTTATTTTATTTATATATATTKLWETLRCGCRYKSASADHPPQQGNFFHY